MAIKKGSLTLRYDLKDIVIESPMDDVVFVADDMLPPIPCNERTAQMPVIPTSAGMKVLDLKRNADGTFKRAVWVWGDDVYRTYEYGYEEKIDNVEAMANADMFDEEVISAKISYNQLKIGREARVVAAMHNTTTFTGATNTLAIINEWDDATNADPYGDITSGHAQLFKKCGKPRSQLKLQINETILRNVMRADKVRADIKYTTPIDKMTEVEQRRYLAQFLGIKEVVVATSFYDQTLLGIEDAEFIPLWSNEYAMLYYPCPYVGSWKVPGVGRQPFWKKFEGRDSDGVRTESYDVEENDSRIVRVREYRGEWINTKYGFLFSNMTT